MKKTFILLLSVAFIAGCATKSKVRFEDGGKPTPKVQTQSRSEPIFYNGKTYQLDYTYAPAKGGFDMTVAGLGPKQAQDSINITTSALAYYACPDGQRGKVIGSPTYVGSKWSIVAKCG